MPDTLPESISQDWLLNGRLMKSELTSVRMTLGVLRLSPPPRLAWIASDSLAHLGVMYSWSFGGESALVCQLPRIGGLKHPLLSRIW
jgi:hypothetical protein